MSNMLDKKFIANSERFEKEKEYWSQKLSGELKISTFPVDKIFSIKEKATIDFLEFSFPNELSQKIIKISKASDKNLCFVLIAGVIGVLHKYTQGSDIIVGSTIYKQEDDKDLVNKILALRSNINEDTSFKQLLVNTKSEMSTSINNQNYPIEIAFEEKGIDRVDNVLKVAVLLENVQSYKYIEEVQANIVFSFLKADNDIKCKLYYNEGLYNKSTIELILKYITSFLLGAINNPDLKISDIDILTETDKKKLLINFNNTRVDFPKNKTIQELFTEQVEKSPNNVAVIWEDKKLTYRELNEKSNQLARAIKNKFSDLDIKKDFVIAIMLERSLEMAIGLLAILKAGGAYLPIDSKYPHDRIEYMLEDSGAKLLLTSSLEKASQLKGSNCRVMSITDESIYKNDSSNIEDNIWDSLAYIIYTSGTTGKPKGVLLGHESVCNTLQWRRQNYKLNTNDKVLQLFSFSFDGFVTSFFTPIISGSTVVFVNEEVAKDAISIKEKIQEHSITHFIAIPTMYLSILECSNKGDLDSLRVITLAGEKLNNNVVQKSREVNNKLEIVNEYGPTENTVVTTSYKIDKEYDISIGSPILIGRGIANTRIYIVDRLNNLCPIGVAGELCVAGVGLAKGYINRPQLTSEKFVINPFQSSEEEIEKMYRTGDLARWLADGNIEFLGRIDYQVKIRGHRIELGEIENRLLEKQDIKEAVVIDREDEAGAKYICAYIVSDNNEASTECRDYLLNYLPDYMIPTYFIQLNQLPLSQSGKIDRKNLPKPDTSSFLSIEYERPRNDIEEKLVEVWEQILKINKIGINDNFFDLGGHSLNASSMVGKLYKEFGAKISVKDVFEAETIKALGEKISKADKNKFIEIKPVATEENQDSYYQISSAQKRIYTLQQFDLKNTVYNIPMVLIIEGELNKQKLEESFKTLIKRHEAFRTSFYFIDEKILQKVHEKVDFEIEYSTSEEWEEEIKEEVKNFIKAFDLTKAPLLRTKLIKLNNTSKDMENLKILPKQQHMLLLDIHHIISDGVSMEILIKEFVHIYEGKKLPDLKVQYKDFANWQNKLFESDYLNEQEKYWIDIFEAKEGGAEIPVLNIPTDYPRPAIQSFEGAGLDFDIDEEITEKLRQIAKETGSSMYMLMLAIFNVLLSKYSGQEDIVIGSPIAGRAHEDLSNIIGMFVNTLAMRNYPKHSKSFNDFLEEVKQNSLSAYENQDYQFEELVDKLNLTRDMSRNPIFDVMFAMQNMGIKEEKLKDLVIMPYKNENKISKFDFTLTALERDKEISINIQYSTKLFKKETIQNLLNHYKNIILQIIKNPSIELSDIELVSESEKHQILWDFNNTKAEFFRNKLFHELFEEQVNKTPNNKAVVCGAKYLTYKELNEKSNQLARILRNKGIGTEDTTNNIVGILIEPSLDTAISIMAIFKAGGTYVAIDSEYPRDRVDYIIKDSGIKILIAQQNLLENLRSDVEAVILNDGLYKGDVDNIKLTSNSNDIAYIIYTSGSTGKPKGVSISHKSLINYISWFSNKCNISSNDKTVLLSSYAFDLGYTSLFSAILQGAELYIVPKDLYINPNKLLPYMKHNNISYVKLTPSLFKIICNHNDNTSIEALNDLRLIVIGGEQIDPLDVKNTYKVLKNTIIMNHYGPSETTIGAIAHIIEPNSIDEYINSPVIGKPINNTKVYIVDKNCNLVPKAVQGELCIAGIGVSKGYINRADLTVERFIDNPFSSEEGYEKLYRTGDLAKWTKDGNIEFMGRIDNQIKIRGYRIELKEIEAKLLKHSDITEAVVLAKEDNNKEKYLCAYIVSKEQLTISQLREYLAMDLPDYMIPSYFVYLEKIPLTPNGKLDIKQLPQGIEAIETGVEYEAPTNETEEKLLSIWKEILVLDKISIKDNFFELGGHSLKATSMMAKIHKQLDTEISLREIFINPTIKKIAKCIETADKNMYSQIQTAEEAENYGLSSAQKRVYTLQQMEVNNTSYNIPRALEIKGKLDIEKLEKAFKELIKRHESLRTGFELINGEMIQKIEEEVDFQIQYEEGNVTKENEDEIIQKFVRAFDLSKAPLLRVGIIKNKNNIESNQKHLLLIDTHHIISDGVSMNILIKEFISIYQEQQLPKLRLQYKDYAIWQNQLLKSEYIKKQEKHWLKVFEADSEGELPVLNMPTDYIRPSIQSNEGNTIDFMIHENLTSKLNNIAKETGSTLYMVMLATINILLAKYSGQEDIIVGSPIAGRPHDDLENIIGMFVNTLAMRNYPKAEKTFEEFLKEVKENALLAYENQDYQFEELIEKLEVKRDLSRNPIFDIMIILQNMNKEDARLGDLSVKQYRNDNKVSKFDISFIAIEMGKEISLSIQYCTKIFKKTTIEKLFRSYINILDEISQAQHKKISDISIMSEEERNKILLDFNNTDTSYYKDKSIHELFEKQVEKNPEAIALVYKNKQLTYKQLNEKANQLGRALIDKGAKKDNIIGILVDRSLDMMVGILAILKTGAAYLPIDPEYPKDRIEYMLSDSKTGVLLTQSKYKDNFDFAGEIFEINNNDDYLDKYSIENISIIDNVEVAYVIYTSGSTGNPKGVMITHYSVNNFIKGMTDKIDFSKDKKILALTTICFDIFGLETLLPLTQGMEIVIAGEDVQKDGTKLIELIENNSINILQATPSRIEMILSSIKEEKALSKLKEIIIGGEAFTKTLVDRLRSNTNAKIYNVYGPTETTIWSTIKELREEEELNIGKPIANTRIYIVDKNNKLQPIGVHGELCIAGHGLSKGYLNREELTLEKFIDNPFTNGDFNFSRMYKTGDLAKWLPNGNIEFLGRIDYQVKIRGFRIELGEIEAKLINQDNIKEAVVLVRENKRSQNKYLCAYLVGEGIETQIIKANLKTKLPEYMVPNTYIHLEQMPLTSNGKIDKKALLALERANENENKIPARDFLDSTIADIWKEILNIDEVFINDDFFELGGNSINIIQIANRIKEVLEIEVTPADLMVYKTISELAEYINDKDEDSGKYKHIFKINRSKSEKKIFIVHGGDADIFYYRHLAKLLEDEYSVYGIQPKGLKTDESLPLNYYEMYHDYVKEIRMIQSQGPYILAGYCIGGYISFDITKIFEMQGEKVAALLQLDQEAFVTEPMYRRIKLNNIIFRAIDMWRKISRKNKNYTLEKFKDIFQKAKPLTKEKHLELLKDKKSLQHYLQFDLAVECRYYYIGKSVKTPVLVIKAEENQNKLFTKELWEKMATGSLEYYEVPGAHTTVLLPPYVEKFADIIKDYLKRTV